AVPPAPGRTSAGATGAGTAGAASVRKRPCRHDAGNHGRKLSSMAASLRSGFQAPEHAMNLTLYASPMSSATPVVHALAELDVDCEIVILDLKAGEQKRPEYLAINPHGVVPTLVVDGTPLFESVAILQWLGEQYGVQRGLWPAAGTPERLEALSWSTWAYVSYGALLNVLNLVIPKQTGPNLRGFGHEA